MYRASIILDHTFGALSRAYITNNEIRVTEGVENARNPLELDLEKHDELLFSLRTAVISFIKEKIRVVNILLESMNLLHSTG